MQSMTGFGKASVSVYPWTIDVEIKTVNNRYFDFRARIPQVLAELENEVKAICQRAFSRGRIEVSVYFRSSEANRTLIVDREYAAKVYAELKAMHDDFEMNTPISMADITGVDGVMRSEPDAFDIEEVAKPLADCVSMACEKCNEMRRAEGERIRESLVEKLGEIEGHRSHIVMRAPGIVLDEKARLERKMQELLDGHDLDPQIVANEIAVYAQKADIDEEMVRLSSHIKQFHQTLHEKKPVGKTLDFLIQEMNREVNTMSSKSNDTELTTYCIAAKTTIEQLREQIQNVE